MGQRLSTLTTKSHAMSGFNAMQQVKKTLTVLAFILLASHLPTSCCLDSCCGERFADEVSSIAAIASDTGAYTNNTFYNRSENSYLDFALRIYVSEVDIREARLEAPAPAHFSLIPTARACDPPPPEPTQRLSDMRLIARDSIFMNDTVYPPGECINALFNFYVYGGQYSSFEEYQREYGQYYFGSPWEAIVLKFRFIPERELTTVIRADLTFDDNSTFGTISPEFRVY